MAEPTGDPRQMQSPQPQQALRTAPPGASGSRQEIDTESAFKTGQLIGGNRFRVERYLGASPTTVNYLCSDTRTDRKVVLKLLRRHLNASEADIEQISRVVAAATAVRAHGLVSILGMGKTGQGDSFIVSDYIDGPTLGFIVAEHRKAGKSISVRDLFAVMSHLCGILQEVHQTTIHSVITPYNIHLTRNGGVLLSNLGIGNQLAALEARTLHTGPFFDSIYVAPEIVEMPEMTTNVADIFSLGMIAVELLHPQGLSADRATAQQQAHDLLQQLPPALRRTLQNAIEPNMTLRTKSVEDFISELESASIQLENNLFREPRPDELPVRALATNQNEADLFDLPEFALPSSESSDGRYLLQINGLDYGPFTEAEVLKKLYADEINEHTEILDRTTQTRCLLSEADVFEKRVREYIPVRDERIRRQAEQREKNIQRVKSGGMGIFIAGILVGAVILGVLGFFLYRLPPQEPLPIAIALPKQDFVFSPPPKDFVPVAVDKSFLNLLFNPKASESDIAKVINKRRKVKRKPVGNSGQANEGGDDIAVVDMTAGGGTDHILTEEEIGEVVRDNWPSVTACIHPYLREHRDFRGFNVKFYIRPSGTAGGVKVDAYQGESVAKCVVDVFRNMRFPASGAVSNRAVSYPLTL